jgi:hypothetical protein
MQILQETEQIKFAVDTAFNSSYLLPVGRYMLWKLENRVWDDYNELFHATAFVENFKTYPDIWLHTHLFLKEDTISGIHGRRKNQYTRKQVPDRKGSRIPVIEILSHQRKRTRLWKPVAENSDYALL